MARPQQLSPLTGAQHNPGRWPCGMWVGDQHADMPEGSAVQWLCCGPVKLGQARERHGKNT